MAEVITEPPPTPPPPPPPPQYPDIFAALAAAQEEQNASKAAAGTQADGELLLLGSKGAGKSTVVYAFTQKDETPKPSTALEYRFARRPAGPQNLNTVANIWELGGGTQLSELLKVVLRPDRLERCVVVIVLDMSAPGDALKTLSFWLQAVRKVVDSALARLHADAAGAATLEELRRKQAEVWAEHPDAQQVRPMGVPLLVVAHKWDDFESNFGEAEYRKLCTRTLRFVCHLNGASLVCTKHKDKQQMTLLRNMMYNLVFGTSPVKSVQHEHSSPLVSPAGSDSFGGVGKPPTVDGVLSNEPLERWVGAYEATFPLSKEGGKASGGQDLSMVEAEQFAEECVDELRRQKRDEVEKLRREARLLEAEQAI